MHIKSLGFRGIRKLYLNEDFSQSGFSAKDVAQFAVSSINVIVGANGGGKSTVVDIIRSLADAAVLSSLPRENVRNTTVSLLDLYLTGGARFIALFQVEGMHEFYCQAQVSGSGVNCTFAGILTKADTEPPPAELQAVIAALGLRVEYRNRHDEQDVPVSDFIDALNENARHLSGLAPFPLDDHQVAYSHPPLSHIEYDLQFPVRLLREGVLSLSLNDDRIQHNHIRTSQLPSGWKAFGGLLAWLASRDEGAICVIEEPESHIHPRLLRVMLKRIGECVERKKLQVFITTHSSIFIDINTWPSTDISLFEANGHQLRALTDPAMALSGLGIRPSDVAQANGVIWVEGASDRIYILNWLRLWCAQNARPMFQENTDFSFVFYGGAMLRHFSAVASDELIEIFKINRNSVVVMDRDLDFRTDWAGQEVAANGRNAKANIYASMQRLQDPRRYCWVTQGYTIESYLPASFRDQYFSSREGRLVADSGVSKVAIAQRFFKSRTNFTDAVAPGTDLGAWLERLHSSICGWNA